MSQHEGFIKELRVDPKKIEQARAEFERWKNSRATKNEKKKAAQFDDVLNMFAQTCVTLTDIGSHLGLTRERARQLYNQIFRPVFGVTRTGRARQRSCTRIRMTAEIATARPDEGSGADLVLKVAESKGLRAEPVVTVNRYAIAARRTRVKINGHLCIVWVSMVSRAQTKHSRHGTYRFFGAPRATPVDFQFAICVTGSGTFIIPADKIEGTIYIPDIPRESMNLKLHGGRRGVEPRVDWWDYFERWDLLGDQTSTKV